MRANAHRNISGRTQKTVHETHENGKKARERELKSAIALRGRVHACMNVSSLEKLMETHVGGCE